MRWKNKGCEFDDMFQQIEQKERFYLFGAGDYGKQFLKALKGELSIAGYIDNDSMKQNKNVNGLWCMPLEELELKSSEGIIVTMSQIARMEAVQELVRMGLKKNIDFFIIEEFISVYYVYKYDRVYFSSISFLPSTVCNLKCRNCLNFNPFAKKFYYREWQDLINDIDLFFSCVDHIMLFHVSGGEPLLYKYTSDIVEYIHNNYGNRIDTLRMVTNGTVVPPAQILERLSKCRIEIAVDDYREAVPEYSDRFEILTKKLEEYGIKYYVNKVDDWVDLAPEKTDFSGMPEEWIIRHREECSQSWQELRDGKLYSCNYAAYASVAGIAGEQDAEEVYDLRTYTNSRKKELVEFRLGYTTKGYTEFCKKCRGFTAYNTDKVIPAKQVEDEK